MDDQPLSMAGLPTGHTAEGIAPHLHRDSLSYIVLALAVFEDSPLSPMGI